MFVQLEKERVKESLTAAYRHLAEGCREDRTELSSEVHRDRVRGKRGELEHGKSLSDFFKFFFSL